MTARAEYVLHEAALRFVGVAALPRLAYRLRWPTRLGPRGLIGYIAFNTLLHFRHAPVAVLPSQAHG